MMSLAVPVFFFFQAEDGIRDLIVTGVQTCALPIWLRECLDELYDISVSRTRLEKPLWRILPFVNSMHDGYDFSWEREWRKLGDLRSEERRVGKECRSRWSPYH